VAATLAAVHHQGAEPLAADDKPVCR